MDHAILADIGATNARFAILADGATHAVQAGALADHKTAEAAFAAWLAGPAAAFQPTRAAIAAAGLVRDGRVEMTNAPWTVEPGAIRAALGLRDAIVVNDFEALAHGLPDLDALVDLGGPASAAGPMAVLGAGTGFGMAGYADGRVWMSEGGHATLSAEDSRDEAIVRAMRAEAGHVSVEVALSGPGLVRLHRAVALADGLVARERDSAGIVARALAGDCEASHAALSAFCAFLGSVAGDAALTLGATGGIYIGGGIAPRFADFLRESDFRARFEAKGRMAPLLRGVPTKLIVDPYPAFKGLARLLNP